MDFRQILGVSDRRRLKLIEILYYNREGTPSEQLISELGCSLPILLSDINMINVHQKEFFVVEKGKGLYRVRLMPDISIGKLYAETLANSPEFQIIEQLLYEQYYSIGILAKSLFLSSSNTQRYLKKIENVLNKAGIRLQYRPLRLEGKESVIRQFYYRYFLEKQDSLKIVLPNIKDYQLRSIEKFVQEFITINGLYRKHIFYKRVAYNIFISLWRIKNGHTYPQKDLRTEGLLLPEKKIMNTFKKTVFEIFRLHLTNEMIRDCLWLSFSDAIVFSNEHLKLALEDNPRYGQLFEKHLTLTKQFIKLMGGQFPEERVQELTTILVNDIYLYAKNGEFLTILRKNREIFLEMTKIMQRRAVEEVTEIVEAFVQEYKMYQKKDFITNYTYLLLTAEVDSLERLAMQDKTIRLLLISDLSPTEEKFITKIITGIVYGNFEIHYFEDIWEGDEEMIKKVLTYDGLITTGSREELPKDFPLVSVDPYVTPQSIVAIQNLVNELSE